MKKFIGAYFDFILIKFFLIIKKVHINILNCNYPLLALSSFRLELKHLIISKKYKSNYKKNEECISFSKEKNSILSKNSKKLVNFVICQ